jgi:hypothetical protein
LISHVWLTAVMVPIAGFPHFDCRCPNGHVKYFCIGTIRNAAGCCCGSACCGAAGQSTCCCARRDQATGRPDKKKACCAGNRSHKISRSSGNRPTLEQSCCTKTVVCPAVFGRTHGQPASLKAPVANVACACHADQVLPLQVSEFSDPRRQNHLLGPPANLRILLRQFQI